MSDYAEKCPTCQQNYNATEENDKLRAALRKLLKQYRDTRNVLDQPNHIVYGWHLNGDGEPINSFFESNDIGAVDGAISLLGDENGL